MMSKSTKSPAASAATTAATIATNIGAYMSDYSSSPYSRYRSYDYCHEVFVKNRGNAANPATVDYLALNLYMFLASWGMVARGRLMMTRNYKFLVDAVKIVCDEKYDWLVDVDVYASTFNCSKYIDDLMALKQQLGSVLFQGTGYKYTDTLLTKILLATLGCVPAYDTNVKKAMRQIGIVASFSRGGLESLLNFAKSHQSAITAEMAKYHRTTLVPYSVMKYIDMALW